MGLGAPLHLAGATCSPHLRRRRQLFRRGLPDLPQLRGSGTRRSRGRRGGNPDKALEVGRFGGVAQAAGNAARPLGANAQRRSARSPPCAEEALQASSDRRCRGARPRGGRRHRSSVVERGPRRGYKLGLLGCRRGTCGRVRRYAVLPVQRADRRFTPPNFKERMQKRNLGRNHILNTPTRQLTPKIVLLAFPNGRLQPGGCATRSAAPLPPTRALQRRTTGAPWDRLADGTVGCVACAR